MRRCVVVGATSNLGSAVVKKLCALGYTCVAVYAHHAPEASEQVLPLQVDVTDEASVKKLSSLESVDLLVYVSGLFVSSEETDIAVSDWDKVFDVNIRGMHLVTQALLPSLKAAPFASIVNVASINAFHPGFGGTVSYDASKGAVVSYTMSLAAEIAPVRVNAVAPGLLDAPYLRTPSNKVRRQFEERAVLHRMVRVEEVAEAVAFLSENRAITGQVITIDAGYLIG